MRFTDICKTYIDRADISLSHQMDFETYLRNHAQEIINLVEAAEKFTAAEDAPRIDGFVPTIESLNDRINARDELRDAIAALNKEQS